MCQRPKRRTRPRGRWLGPHTDPDAEGRLTGSRRLGYPQTHEHKNILLEAAAKLPFDASPADTIYKLEFRQAVEEGLASLNSGERIPPVEARKRIPQ